MINLKKIKAKRGYKAEENERDDAVKCFRQ